MKSNVYARMCVAIAIAVAVLGSVVTKANAQAWIGQIAGEMAADQAAAAREQACLAGTPADPDDVKKANQRIEKRMDEYFALTASSTADDVRDVYTTDKSDQTWKDGAGAVPIEEVPSHLRSPVPQRTLVALVVGGDDATARAIWSVTPVGGSDVAYYAGDFFNQGWWGGGWKIWHLEALPASTKPDVPAAYCHFDPEQTF